VREVAMSLAESRVESVYSRAPCGMYFIACRTPRSARMSSAPPCAKCGEEQASALVLQVLIGRAKGDAPARRQRPASWRRRKQAEHRH
jgi:hypothetical protein